MKSFQQARLESFNVEWKLGYCAQGDNCWCRTIQPVEPILYDDNEEYFVVGQATIDKKTAEYIVKLHNNKIKKKSWWFMNVLKILMGKKS